MKTALISALLCYFSIQSSTTDNAFPIPNSLNDNVEFWKTIYTKVSLKEGLIHDRDYPLIIYEKLSVGTLYGRQLDNYTDKYEKKYAIAIRNVRLKSRTTWGPNERKIALLFKNLPPEALKGAEKRIRFQQGQKERFIEGLRRSGELIDTIRYILKSYKVPLRLAYLPHVESSFDYGAYSHAGAAGLWQFMPETGKKYLHISTIIDERRDPILSTIAAAKLLSHNYELLKSWPLAITAYNYGLTGVIKAVKNTGSHDIGIILGKHESPSFRFASKNFYSCFIAASEIAQNPFPYFGRIEYKGKFQVGAEVILNTQLHPFEIGRMLGIPEESIAEMNPSILPGVFKKQLPLPIGTRIRLNNHLITENVKKKITLFYQEYPQSQKRITSELQKKNKKNNSSQVRAQGPK